MVTVDLRRRALRTLSLLLDTIGAILAGLGLTALAALVHPFLAVFVAGVVCLLSAIALDVLAARRRK